MLRWQCRAWRAPLPLPMCAWTNRWAWQKRSWSQELLTNNFFLCLILCLTPTLVWVYPSHPFILGIIMLISEGTNTGKKRENWAPKLPSVDYSEHGHACLHLLFPISSGTNELTHFLLLETTELSTSLKRHPKYWELNYSSLDLRARLANSTLFGFFKKIFHGLS